MAVFTVIDHTELGAAASSYDVTSISASYDHLYFLASARSDESAYYSSVNVRVGNGSLDTGTNYSTTWLAAWSATPWSWRDSGIAQWTAGYVGADSDTADTFSVYKLWIPNYANTANYKQSLASMAVENASTTDNQWGLFNVAGLWASTAAIDTFSFYAGSEDFMQYSTFTLYGVTGA